MFKFIYNLPVFEQMDYRIYDLEKQVEFFSVLLMIMTLLVAILVIVVLFQRFSIQKMKSAPGNGKSGRKKRSGASLSAGKKSGRGIDTSELPDPGIIFRYSLPADDGAKKIISVGRDQGSIKTWSTEILNDHLELQIMPVSNFREKMIYELPDRLYVEYLIEIRHNGNVLIHYPGLDGYRRMDSVEKVLIKRDPDPSGIPTFGMIEANRPLRFRLGQELGDWDRFTGGYFEFHLYLQDTEVETESGMPRIEKNFMLRLYRIYPGYDISSPDENGLYPMIDPFSAGK